MPELADLSYERLAATRTSACQLLDSGVLFMHERTHLTDIIARIDQTVRLKRDRDQARAERSARTARQDARSQAAGASK